MNKLRKTWIMSVARAMVNVLIVQVVFLHHRKYKNYTSVDLFTGKPVQNVVRYGGLIILF